MKLLPALLIAAMLPFMAMAAEEAAPAATPAAAPAAAPAEKATEAAAPAATADAAAGDTHEYPAGVGEIFVKSCTGENPKMKAYCSCVFENVQKEMTLNQFTEFSKKPEADMLKDEKFTKAISACISKMEQ